MLTKIHDFSREAETLAKIKICGIKDVDTALKVAELGVDFIGLVFSKKSPRYVSMEKAFQITSALKNSQIQCVAVVDEADEIEMMRICETLNVRMIQLHGPLPKARHHLLSENITRIYVCSLSVDGALADIDDISFEHLDPHRDYLLFDSIEAGSGKSYSLESFSRPEQFNFFMAGGLIDKTVNSLIHEVSPFAVDVSSGVESTRGIKDINKIKTFVNSVRQCK